jgi:predicted GNAT family N-acyltransferase
LQLKVSQIKHNTKDYNKTLELRNEILRKPLNLDIKNDDIYDEDQHIHFGIIQEDKALGVVVLVPHYQNKVGKLRQMATAEEVRGKGYGKALVKALENYALKHGMSTILLHSRFYAVDFYLKLGYEICSEPFEEVGIEHFKMKKMLSE